MAVVFCPGVEGVLPMMSPMVVPVPPRTAPRSLSRPPNGSPAGGVAGAAGGVPGTMGGDPAMRGIVSLHKITHNQLSSTEDLTCTRVANGEVAQHG